jgi:hypothetical protein
MEYEITRATDIDELAMEAYTELALIISFETEKDKQLSYLN